MEDRPTLCRRLAALIALIGASIQSGGCMQESYAKAQVPWGYVYDVGSSKEIAAWTLEQNCARQISGGLAALQDMILLRPREAGDAIEGIGRVYTKLLGGWQGYADQKYSRTDLIRGTRRMVTAYVRRNPEHPMSERLLATLLEIDPNADETYGDIPGDSQPGGTNRPRR